MALLADMKADVAAMRARRGRIFDAAFPKVATVLLYRVSRSFWVRGKVWKLPAIAIYWLNQALTGAELNPDAEIGPGFIVCHAAGVVVGPGVKIGSNVTVFGGVVFGDAATGAGEAFYPVVGDGATFYAKASVLGGVHVGEDARIGAHAVVLSDVPARTLAVGIPARVRVRQADASQ